MPSDRALRPSSFVRPSTSSSPVDSGGSLGDGCESTVSVKVPSSGCQQITVNLSFPAKAIIGQLCALSHIANPLRYDLVYYPLPESGLETLAHSPEVTLTKSKRRSSVKSIPPGWSPVISSSLTGRRGSLSLGRSNSEISTRKPLWRRRQRSFVKTLDRELTEHSVLVLPEDVVKLLGDISLEEQGFVPQQHTLELIPKRRASYSRSSEQRSLNKEDFSSTLAYKDCVWQFTSGAWPCNSDRAAKDSERKLGVRLLTLQLVSCIICALQICADHGDANIADVPKKTLKKWIRDGLPLEYRKEEEVYITASALFSTMAKSTSPQQARELYVQHCQKLDTYRATFFVVKIVVPRQHDDAPQILAISATSVVLLNAKTRQMLITMPLADITDVVATDTEFRLEFKNTLKLFAMTHQAHEIEATVTHHVKNARKQMRRGSHSTSDIPQCSNLPMRTYASTILETQGDDLSSVPLRVESNEEQQVADNQAQLQTDGSFGGYVDLLPAYNDDAFDSPIAAPNHSNDTLSSLPLSINKQPRGTVCSANWDDTPDKRPTPKPRANSWKMQSLENGMLSTAGTSHQCSQGMRSVSPSNDDQLQQVNKQIELVTMPNHSDMVDNSATRNSCPHTALELGDHRADNYQPLLSKGDRSYPALPTASPSQEYENLDTTNMAISSYKAMSQTRESPPKTKREQAAAQVNTEVKIDHKASYDTDASFSQNKTLTTCDDDAFDSPIAAPNHSNDTLSSLPLSLNKQPRGTVCSANWDATPDKRPTPKPRANSGKMQSLENEMLLTAGTSHQCFQGMRSVSPSDDDQLQQINKQIELVTMPNHSDMVDNSATRNSCPHTALELGDHRADNYQPLLSKRDRSYPALPTTSPSQEYENLDTTNMAISSYKAMSQTRESPPKTKREQAAGQVKTVVKIDHKASNYTNASFSQSKRQQNIQGFGESAPEDCEPGIALDTSTTQPCVTHGVTSKPEDNSKDLSSREPDPLLAQPFTLPRRPLQATNNDGRHDDYDDVCLPSVIQPYMVTKITSPPLLAPSTETSSGTVAPLRNTILPKTCHGHAQNAILKVSKSHSGQGTVSASSMTAAIVKSQVFPQLPEHHRGVLITPLIGKTVEDQASYDDDDVSNPYLIPMDYPDDKQPSVLSTGKTCMAGSMSSSSSNTLNTPTSNSRHHSRLSSCSSLTSSQKSRESSSCDAQASTKPGGDPNASTADTDSPAHVTVGSQGTPMERKDALGTGIPLAISKRSSQVINLEYRRCTLHFACDLWLCDAVTAAPIAALQAYAEQGDEYDAKKTSNKTIREWVKECLPSCYEKEKSALSAAVQHFKTLSEECNLSQAKQQYIHLCEQLVTYNSRSFFVRAAISQEKRLKPCAVAVSSTSIIHLNENRETLKVWQLESLTKVTRSWPLLQLTFSDGFCLSVQTDEGDAMEALVVRNLQDVKRNIT